MIIAIKGIMGSGKTTISRMISEKYGYRIINCDHECHKLYENDKDLISRINEKFDLSGDIVDRKKLSKVVFNDKQKLLELEEIVHPILRSTIQNLLDTDDKVLLDCQVIDKLELNYDFAILVTADRNVITKRILDRDNRSLVDINNIIDLQARHYVLDKRTYTLDTTNIELVEDKIQKILRSFDDCQNWEDSEYARD